MLWLQIEPTKSHEIISCNTCVTKEGFHQVWVERPNGKTLMVKESESENEIKEIKEAIDFAISVGEKSLKLYP